MQLLTTSISGAFLVELEKNADSRGFFARAWCSRIFAEHGLSNQFVQTNISYNRRSGTLRGMHYQAAPHQECKMVRCTQGEIYDVIIDLRPQSDSYGDWFAVKLTAANHRMLYIPKGCAHGYQTLADDSEILYMVSDYYCPECERGLCYDDPEFAIAWPHSASDVSEKDRSWPKFELKWPLSIPKTQSTPQQTSHKQALNDSQTSNMQR
jgi:dTDP-4-dehydrorhamnose 3,5-epimerase